MHYTAPPPYIKYLFCRKLPMFPNFEALEEERLEFAGWSPGGHSLVSDLLSFYLCRPIPLSFSISPSIAVPLFQLIDRISRLICLLSFPSSHSCAITTSTITLFPSSHSCAITTSTITLFPSSHSCAITTSTITLFPSSHSCAITTSTITLFPSSHSCTITTSTTSLRPMRSLPSWRQRGNEKGYLMATRTGYMKVTL